MFKKDKQPSAYNMVDDSRKTVVYDFQLRTTKSAYEAYRTVEYSLYDKLKEEKMLPQLDEYLEKLFNGSVDSGNENALNDIIFAAVREGLLYLNIQYINHADMIRRFVCRRKSDYKDIKKIRDERVKELEIIQGDYDKICKLLDKAGEV